MDGFVHKKKSYLQRYSSGNMDTRNSIQVPKRGKSNYGMERLSLFPRRNIISCLRNRFEWILVNGYADIEAFDNSQETLEEMEQAYPDEPQLSWEKPANFEEMVSAKYDELREMAKDMGKDEREHDMEVTVQFIEFILQLWHEQLQSCPAEEREGFKALYVRSIYTQTQDYLKPLLSQLKAFNVLEDISDSLKEIVGHLLNANYSRARDVYVRMAILHDPWPIVLKDERKRKFIQGLERLMAKSQEFYPTDPSRCAEYAPERDQLL
ncbi:pre-mRNA-splicing factor 18-like [Zophobas morio]|uniref:pre-mRNA-splicing factor 18-like n=1 Tax=Zophobas morio TaxID=2755281 RepID=UPI003083151B